MLPIAVVVNRFSCDLVDFEYEDIVPEVLKIIGNADINGLDERASILRHEVGLIEVAKGKVVILQENYAVKNLDDVESEA